VISWRVVLKQSDSREVIQKQCICTAISAVRVNELIIADAGSKPDRLKGDAEGRTIRLTGAGRASGAITNEQQ